MTNLSPRTAQVHRPQSIDEQQQSIRTRRTILAAATDLINTGRAVSIGDLTASGVTRGDIHFHFETKHGLIRGLIDDAADQVHRRSTPGGDQCPHRHRW
ncbi:MAG: TetR/AcrR family transcriptional regulator [Rhodococcus sp. (in: high G+C Gram-positive bacteria)]|uniref:TetR/AcrR family transcriptional regulator n=1 Tax=Rhodococcus sp. BS-15 TaxID=1304954 RepID=UPI000AC5BD4D|nr:TetR/AcrR family transcriptional regulator [Rhodococcus sp. BS-15]